MIRRPPRTTRTDTLFPYTTLVLSGAEMDRPFSPPDLVRGQVHAEVAALQRVARQRRPRPAELGAHARSEEHTSELQSLLRISYAVFCLKNQKHNEIVNH